MDEFWRDTFRSVMTPLRALRFSLATLLLATCFVASCIAVWVNREPWEIAAKVDLPYFVWMEMLRVQPLNTPGKILIARNRSDYPPTIWNWRTGELTRVEVPNDELLLSIAHLAGRFLTTDRSGTARVRQIGSPNPLVELPHWIFPTASNPRISPDGNRIAASGPDGAVWLYDLDKQKELSFPASGKSATKVTLEFSGDSKWLQAYDSSPKAAPGNRGQGWQVIDCDQGILVPIPKAVLDRIDKTGASYCTFMGTENWLFVSWECAWRVGTEEFIDWPKFACAVSPDVPPAYIAFHTQAAGIDEIWTSDLGHRMGCVDSGYAGMGRWGDCLSPSGRQGIFRIVDRAVLCDTVTGQRIHPFPESLEVAQFLTEDLILGLSGSEVQVWRRRRPEYAWGIMALPEFWLMPIFLIAAIFSVRRDRRRLKGAATCVTGRTEESN